MASIENLYSIYLAHPVICTDTRAVTKDCLFFALKGDNFDANTFAEKAIAQGAAYAVVDNPAYAVSDKYILVDDSLSQLQALATYHRKQLQIPVIGLTGSNGKTTTKELIRAVLAEKYTVFATKGNLNNHIGVPLSILSISQAVEIAVIEMGANHQKEIAFLCNIAQPTHGLISNVGMAHLEGFGGFEGVKKGKAELYTHLATNNGTAFLNAANTDLSAMLLQANPSKVITYNTAMPNTVHGVLRNSDPMLDFEWSVNDDTYKGKANLTGVYNFENVLAAIAIASFFEVSPAQINNGLANYFPTNNRSQLTKTERNTIICDFYNANPSSMAAALKNIEALQAPLKTAILGDMFELGEQADAQHQDIITKALKAGLNNVIFVGSYFFKHKNDDALFFNTPKEAAKYLEENPLKDELILLKGSRGMALEQLLPLL